MADRRNLELYLLGRDVSASRALKNMGDRAGTTARHFDVLGKSARIAGFAIKAGVLAGVAGSIAVFKTGYDEVKGYTGGLSQLQAGIKSTGGAANVTAPYLEKLASQIQNYSGQTDDSIVKTESLLLTFPKIRDEVGKGNDVFTRTTKIAADMAARMGTDASSAAIKLGKAIADPVAGISALTRVGVVFNDKQKTTIARLVESGDTLGAQKIILRELTKEFGGSARKFGDSFPGQIERTKRAFEDVSQQLVTAALPAMTATLRFINDKLIPGIGDLRDRMGRAFDVIAEKVGPTFDRISVAAARTIPTFQSIWKVIKTQVIPVVVDLARGVGKQLQSSFRSVKNAIADNGPQLKQLAKAIGTVIVIAVKLAGPILKHGLIQQLKNLSRSITIGITVIGGIVRAFDGMASAAKSTGRGVRSAFDSVLDFIRGIPGKIKGFFSDAGTWLVNAGKQIVEGLLQGIEDGTYGRLKDFVGGIKDKITGWKGPIDADRVALIPHGQAFMEGLVKGIESGQRGLRSSLTRLVDFIRARLADVPRAARDSMRGLIGQLRDSMSELDKLTNERRRIAGRLTSVQGNADALASGITSGLTGAVDITQASHAGTGDILTYLRHQRRGLRTFRKDLRTLRRRGVSKQIIDQLAAAGVEQGGATAHALAVQAGRGDIAQINRLSLAIRRDARAIGQSRARADYGPHLRALRRELRGVRREIAHRERRITVILEGDLKQIVRDVRVEERRDRRRKGKDAEAA